MLTPSQILKLVLLAVVNPGFLATLISVGAPDYPVRLLLVFISALIQGLGLAAIVLHHNGKGKWELIWKTSLLFYGVTFFQSGIEAVLFLNYMQSTMTQADIYAMVIFGLVNTAVIVPIAVLLFHIQVALSPQLSLPPKTLLLRFSALSMAYMIIYIVFGALVFMPLAGTHFDTYYGNMVMPDWLFPFQIVRGLIWVALAYGVLTLISGERTLLVYITTMFIALPFSSLLLPHNEVMPLPIRMAHLVEILSSMLLFGFLCGRLLTKKV